MRCKKCGEELPERARFCYVCGAPVEEVPAPKRLEEPLDPLAAGAVPLVPLAPPPRAYTLEPRARRAAARADLRSQLPSIRPQEPVVERVDADARPQAQEDAVAEKDAATQAAAPANRVEEPVEPAAEESVAPAAEREAAPQATEEVDATQAVEPAPAPDAADAEAPASTPASTAALTTEKLKTAAKSAASTTSEFIGTAGTHLASAGRQLRAGGRTVAEGFEGSRVPTVALVGGIAVVALIAVSVLFVMGTSWIGPFAPADEQAPVVQPPSDGSIPPLEADDEEEEAEEEQPVPEGAPEVREALGEYSWQELSQISAVIADASSDAEGVKIAAEYNLCGADGSLDATQTKDLELSGGTTVPVAVAGIRSDERSDGSGVAGITLVTRASLGKRAYGPDGPVSWEDSPIRSWLNQTVPGQLPEGLADLLVSVDKTSNAPDGGQCQTSDLMWLLSYAELCGPASWLSDNGTQYRLFADQGVSTSASSQLTLADDYWWMRTAGSDGRYQMTVTPEGDPNYSRNPVYEFDVIAGFCL